MAVYHTILITAVVYHHVQCSAVQETFKVYLCAPGPQTFKDASKATDCEQIWTIENNAIGRFFNSSVDCHRPCIRVNPGKIITSGCVNTTLTVLCKEEYMTEYRIHFHGKVINPPKNDKDRARYGVGVLLAVALGVIFLIYKSLHCGSINGDAI